jgi:hypothetical protein
MDHPSSRQWVPFQEVSVAAPEEPFAPIPSRQPFLPDARDHRVRRPARDDAVHVRMMRERRTPSVQHHGDADLGVKREPQLGAQRLSKFILAFKDGSSVQW